MNIFQEKASRQFLISLFFLFLLGLLLNLGMILEHSRSVQNLLLLHDERAASILLKEQVPRDTVARALAGTETTPEGIRLIRQMGFRENGSPAFRPLLFGYLHKSALLSFLGLFLLCALFLAASLRFLLARERLYLKAIQTVSAYADGRFQDRLPQSGEGTLFRLFGYVNHMALALKAGQEAEHNTKEFLKTTISDISHQLKTPLAALSLYNEILLEEPENPQTVRTFAKKSQASVERMQTLILSLLKIARLDIGSIAFQKTPLSASRLLTAALDPLLARAAQEEKSLLLPDVSGKIFFCDPIWTTEALGNLLKNALDHTEKGQSISISFVETPLETGICVSNLGPGIPPEDLHHIFKRFYRGKSSLHTPGAGLGLPLAKAIAEGQGGRILVHSVPGEGAEFTLFLPSCSSLQN